jgi:2-oxo-4-hydroxy-4-carboxy-5-ureidoimidazoline decarboxylase
LGAAIVTGSAASVVPAAAHTLVNGLDADDARRALTRCCGSSAWVSEMLTRRPFASAAELYAAAETVWRGLSRRDFLEAFSQHPPIGQDHGHDHDRDAAGDWSAEEQGRVAGAPADVAVALAAANRAYAARFGYIFIVCATGKTADEMLRLLRARLDNTPADELAVAAAEQAKITRLRLEKLAR